MCSGKAMVTRQGGDSFSATSNHSLMAIPACVHVNRCTYRERQFPYLDDSLASWGYDCVCVRQIIGAVIEVVIGLCQDSVLCTCLWENEMSV